MDIISEVKIRKKEINITLSRILTYFLDFMKIYKKSANFLGIIDKDIFSHPIYKNRKALEKFTSIINNAGLNYKEEILKIKEKSVMKLKRTDELEQINTFIDTNYEKLLADINKSENKLLLSSQLELISISNFLTSFKVLALFKSLIVLTIFRYFFVSS